MKQLRRIVLLLQLNSDNFYIRDLQRNVKFMSATNAAPIYLYRLSIESTLNFEKISTNIKNPGKAANTNTFGF